ncbi:MAG: RNA polymerase-associated protein RapA, partial [Gammaproteobacteria bacterium]|nr:RNA polymerase-associated protein RapA [Gammaproteobacteria bacterium]
GLLLLSATPEQLGQASHFARLRLLDPDRFHSLNAFIKEQQDYQPIAELVEKVHDKESWDKSLIDQIKKYVDDIEVSEANRDVIIKELLDRNGTGRVLYRNTRKNIAGFPKRKVRPHPLPAVEQYQNEISEHLQDSIELLLHPETQFTDESWVQFDPRVNWLKDFLKQHIGEKVLIICAKKETAIALDLHSRFKFGFNCSTFHEDMDIISRDRAAAYFADMEDGAQALFCSEIGSEGRNFQFSHHLVLMDLPLNPDLLEQRIGRLDRIGQTEEIQIHIPFIQQSAQEVIFNWYHQGMNAFEQTNAAGSNIFKQTQAELFDTLLNYDDEKQLQSLIETTKACAEKANQDLQSGRDKLLEMGSFDAGVAAELIEAVNQSDENSPANFMDKCWDKFGVQVEEQSDNTLVVSPGDHMYIGSFPSLPEDGITATFDRKTAIARDDVYFLSWEHPMVIGATDLVLSQDKGNASVCMLKNKAVKAGTLLMEVLYHVESIAPRHLQAQRFLPYTCIRTLVNVDGKDIAGNVSHQNLNKQCHKLPKQACRQLIKSERTTLSQMVKMAEQSAHQQADSLISDSLEKMKSAQQIELNRLLSLQKKNANIRNEEIDFVKNQTRQLEKYLSDTQLQLEAIRVIVAV